MTRYNGELFSLLLPDSTFSPPLFSTFLELPQYNHGMNLKKSMLKKN